MITIRGTDLIVVVDNEVRIASLVDAKASAANQPISPSPSTSSKSALTYKVLAPAPDTLIDLDIRHLSINPTGKLLACVGDSQITLIVMPRSGYTKHVDREIVCRTVPVAPYYHSAHSNAAISKVDWHPWGENGTSLLVLTEDGILREYDVAKDTEEPQQTASFLPISIITASQRSRSRSTTPCFNDPTFQSARGGFGLSADDDDATTAVSFSLCVTDTPFPRSTIFDRDDEQAWAASASQTRGPSDWSPLTIFGLMKNGDVYAICPFLPKSAIVPAAYIHNLAKLASHRANANEAQQTTNVDAQLRYVKALLKQTSSKSSHREGHSRRQSSVTPGPEAFARSRSTSAMDLDQAADISTVSQGFDAAAAASDEVQDGPVRLHPPSWSFRQDIRQGGSAKKAPRPQGPFLLKPAPVELCDERESVACDLIWTWLTDESGSVAPEDAVTGVAALSIVGHDGRVDVGLIFESVEASWESSSSASRQRSAARRRSKTSKTNRYGLSDTEDEADELEALSLEDPEELPSLLIYETINLGLLDSALENGISSRSAASDVLLDKMAGNKPCFVRDPLYGDTLYVYHAFGAQCLGFATWASKLIEALNLPSQDELDNDADASQINQESREKALVKMLHHGHNTEVVWVVNTLAPNQNGLEVNHVTAVSILSDVYLSYAFLAVTADLQLVGVELSLRIEQDDLVPTDSRNGNLTVGGGEASNGSKQYISLLGEGPPFQPPALFSSAVQGLPQHPRRAARSAALSGTPNANSELQIKPETLRALGKTVESYRHEIRDVVSAGNAVQARLDLQVREMTRQLEKLNCIRLRCASLSSASDGSKSALSERVQKIAQTQLQLVARIDKALQRLMDSHQPSLSIYEKKWFEELERIASEVGVSRTDDGEVKLDTKNNRKALAAKAELLSHQLGLLRPQMVALQEQGKVGGGRDGMLGGEQLKKVEKLLSSEAAMLAEAKEKVQQLNKRIAHIKPLRDAPAGRISGLNGSVGDADLSISFSNMSGFGGGGGLPTSSTAANFRDMSFASPRRTRSRAGSKSFF